MRDFAMTLLPAQFAHVDAATEAQIASNENARPVRCIRLLMQRLMAEARRLKDTPLQFQIDGPGIVLSVWEDIWPQLAMRDRTLLADGELLCASLDELLAEACAADDAPAALDDFFPRSRVNSADVEQPANSSSHNPLPRLAAWFDRGCAAIRFVHPQAIEVMSLRLEGYDARDIAERLGTGARLVRRLLAELRAGLSASVSSR
jgi:hypothetical protein